MNIPEELFESLQNSLSERGNTSLRNYENGDAIFFHEVTEGVWLEVVHISDNYPAWSIQTVNKSKDEIVSHIEENFDDPWLMQKNNIGVNCNRSLMPMPMDVVLEQVSTDLYLKERMTKKDDIEQAVYAILEEREWTISNTNISIMVNEYYNTL